jgi:hypothetical protein
MIYIVRMQSVRRPRSRDRNQLYRRVSAFCSTWSTGFAATKDLTTYDDPSDRCGRGEAEKRTATKIAPLLLLFPAFRSVPAAKWSRSVHNATPDEYASGRGSTNRVSMACTIRSRDSLAKNPRLRGSRFGARFRRISCAVIARIARN